MRFLGTCRLFAQRGEKLDRPDLDAEGARIVVGAVVHDALRLKRIADDVEHQLVPQVDAAEVKDSPKSIMGKMLMEQYLLIGHQPYPPGYPGRPVYEDFHEKCLGQFAPVDRNH